MSTEPMPLLDFPDAKPRRRVVFDPTVNLGHILTFFGFLATGFAAYQSLDRRQTVQETRFEASESRTREQDVRVKEALAEVRQEMKELRHSVDELNRTVSRQNGQREPQR